MSSPLAESHERRIHDDAGKPCRERRPALKGIQVAVGFAQSILERILDIFLVAEHDKCSTLEPRHARSNEKFEGPRISGYGLLHKSPLIADGARSRSGVEFKLPRNARDHISVPFSL